MTKNKPILPYIAVSRLFYHITGKEAKIFVKLVTAQTSTAFVLTAFLTAVTKYLTRKGFDKKGRRVYFSF